MLKPPGLGRKSDQRRICKVLRENIWEQSVISEVLEGIYTIKVSIALTTYNGERYLQEQLNSFLHQTRLPDEIIACDDCSTDRTMDVLEFFAKSALFGDSIYKHTKELFQSECK